MGRQPLFAKGIQPLTQIRQTLAKGWVGVVGDAGGGFVQALNPPLSRQLSGLL